MLNFNHKIMQVVPAPKNEDGSAQIMVGSEPVLFMALLEDGTLRPLKGICTEQMEDQTFICTGFRLPFEDGEGWKVMKIRKGNQ